MTVYVCVGGMGGSLLQQGFPRRVIKSLVLFKRGKKKKSGEVFDAELEPSLSGIENNSIYLRWLLRSTSNFVS